MPYSKEVPLSCPVCNEPADVVPAVFFQDGGLADGFLVGCQKCRLTVLAPKPAGLAIYLWNQAVGILKRGMPLMKAKARIPRHARQCSNCRWYDPKNNEVIEDGQRRGTCCLLPPKVADGGYNAGRPAVYQSWLCSKWKQRHVNKDDHNG